MFDDLISPEDIKIVEPTMHIDMDQNLLDHIRKFDENFATGDDVLGGIYISPDNPNNLHMGSHVIATVPYLKEERSQMLAAVERQINLNYSLNEAPVISKLLDKERQLLERTYSGDTDEYEVGNYRRVHEETHQFQEIRMDTLSASINLQKKLEEMAERDERSKPEFEETAGADLEMRMWAETQAYRQSLLSKNIRRENRIDLTQTTLSPNATFFAINESGTETGKIIYDFLKEGKLIDMGKELYLPPHSMAYINLLMGNTDFSQKIHRGDLSYEEWRAQMFQKLEILAEKPEEILSQISDPELGKAIESKLEESVSRAKELVK